MFLLYLVLHTAQPAAVTTVAMETSGVSTEQALNRGDKGAERLTDSNWILRKERKGLDSDKTGLESSLKKVEGWKEPLNCSVIVKRSENIS